MRWRRRRFRQGLAFVYPALSAVVFAPFALLGQADADHLYMLMCFLLVPATLWAAGVRDLARLRAAACCGRR